MNRTQKNLTIAAWVLALVAIVSFVASGIWRGHQNQPQPVYGETQPHRLDKFYEVPDFNLVNQDGKPFTRKDVAGKVWIADLIFTQCAGACPKMTAEMAGLQKELANTPVQFVSISVDPAHDTPAMLKQYAKNIDADEKTWTFATGEPPQIFGLAAAMKVSATPADPQNQIMHAEKFILVDAQGWIRGYYFYKDPQKRAELLEDARKLALARG
jgi:protein SCO1/2